MGTELTCRSAAKELRSIGRRGLVLSIPWRSVGRGWNVAAGLQVLLSLFHRAKHRDDNQNVEDENKERRENAVEAQIDECKQVPMANQITDEDVWMVAFVRLSMGQKQIHGDEAMRRVDREEE